MRVLRVESNWGKLSQIKSGTVSQIKLETAGLIKSAIMTSAKLPEPMIALASDTLHINGQNRDVAAAFTVIVTVVEIPMIET